MKKAILALALTAAVVSPPPSPALAEQTPVKSSASYNTDSDGVSFTTYSISTEKKNKPWNFTYSTMRIRQQDSTEHTINETRFLARWQYPFNDEAGMSAWAGYTDSNAWKFVSYGIEYHGVADYTDQFRLSYNHDSVPTVSAYKQHISGNSLYGDYRREIDRKLILNTSLKYTSYSDENFRKTMTIALAKDFSPRYRLGLAYCYDTSDKNKRSVFYLPKGESSLSLVPEIALPAGEGIFVMKATKSLFARNVNGSMSRTTYGAGYYLKNLYLGMQYYRDDDYWSRDYVFSWNNRW